MQKRPKQIILTHPHVTRIIDRADSWFGPSKCETAFQSDALLLAGRKPRTIPDRVNSAEVQTNMVTTVTCSCRCSLYKLNCFLINPLWIGFTETESHQGDCPGHKWGRWSLSSVSPATIKAVILTTCVVYVNPIHAVFYINRDKHIYLLYLDI